MNLECIADATNNTDGRTFAMAMLAIWSIFRKIREIRAEGEK